jgi:hypothetical protein
MHQEQFEVVALSDGPPVEFAIPWLSVPRTAAQGTPEAPPAETSLASPEPAASLETPSEAAEPVAPDGEPGTPVEEPPARG